MPPLSRNQTKVKPLPFAIQPSRMRVDRMVQDFVSQLSAAKSSEAIGEALSALGGRFRLPSLYLGHNRKTPDGWRLKRIFRSPKAPRSLLRALAQHPMAQAAAEAREPVTLTDYNLALTGSGWSKPGAFEDAESIVINVETAPNMAILAVFSGRGGMVNGAMKSILTFATHLAVDRLTLPVWPVPPSHDLTDRERQIIALAKDGLTDAAIGRKLNIAARTIRYHLTKAMQRNAISSRAQLFTTTSLKSSKAE